MIETCTNFFLPNHYKWLKCALLPLRVNYFSDFDPHYSSNMQMSTSPMTQCWSTDSAPMQMAFTWSNMQIHEVKAEAVPCLQVGFMLYKHMHISISSVNQLLSCELSVSKHHIELHLLTNCTAVHVEPEVEIKIQKHNTDSLSSIYNIYIARPSILAFLILLHGSCKREMSDLREEDKIYRIHRYRV